MITRTEIAGRTDRETFEILVTRYSRFENIVLWTQHCFRLEFQGADTKTLICNTTLLIRVLPQTIDIKDPRLNSMMSKEPKQKTNQHAHSPRDQGYLGLVYPKES